MRLNTDVFCELKGVSEVEIKNSRFKREKKKGEDWQCYKGRAVLSLVDSQEDRCSSCDNP
jgi:hypothetical protein